MLRIRITVLIVLAAMVAVVAHTGALMQSAGHPQIVRPLLDADDDTPTPGGTVEPTPSPKPAFVPLVFRDPTATRTPTPTATNTRPPTSTPIRSTPTSPPPTQRPPTAEPTSRPCCRCCTRGRSKPCGDTCISESRNCNTPPGCACFCVLSPVTGEEVCNPDEVNDLIRRFPELRYDALPELRGQRPPP